MSDKIIRMQEFVKMYGSRSLSVVQDHKCKKTDEKLCLLAECPNLQQPITTDLELQLFSCDDIRKRCDPEKTGTRNILTQLSAYDPTHQAIMGLVFDDGDVTSLILEIKKID